MNRESLSDVETAKGTVVDGTAVHGTAVNSTAVHGTAVNTTAEMEMEDMFEDSTIATNTVQSPARLANHRLFYFNYQSI